jgi:hypothetical protein
MPRVRPLQSSFANGEVSDLVEGRVDLERYFSSCRTLRNWTIRHAGGVTRRPGTRYIATVKDQTKTPRLFKFQQSVANSYVLEFGEGYIRFFADGAPVLSGGTPVEVATPYLAADLPLLTLTQSNDVIYITSLYYQPRRLERYSDTVWKLRTETYAPPPSYEYGQRPTGTMTPAAATGSGIVVNTSTTEFEAADVGRELVVTAGASIGARATIATYVTQQQVTVNITQNFAGTSAIAATDWKMTDSPRTQVTPSAKTPVGLGITLTGAAACWRARHVGQFVHINGGCVEITSLTSTTVANGVIRAELNATTAAEADAWTLEEAAWSSHNGWPACTEFHEGRHVYASSLAQPYVVWASKTDDYPNFAVGVLDDDAIEVPISGVLDSIVWLHASRALLAGTGVGEVLLAGANESPLTPTNVQVKPQTGYGSTDRVPPVRVGNVLLFTTVSQKQVRELVFDFNVDSYVAPDLTLLADHLTRDSGITQVAYQREPTSTLWGVREDGTLLGMTYLRDQNVVAWHRHVTGAIDADELPVDGFVESVCVIPHPDGDREQVWLAVQRTVNGATRRYIEYFDDAEFFYRTLHTDCAVTYDGTGTTTLTLSATSGTGVTATAGAAFFEAADVGRQLWLFDASAKATVTGFTSSTVVTVTVVNAFPGVGPHVAGAWGVARTDLDGLAHLEGKAVAIVVDGAVLPEETVASGAVTADTPGIVVEVGLPYTARLVTVRPELQVAGTTQGVPGHWSEVIVRVWETLGLSITVGSTRETVTFRKTSDRMDQPPPLFTGDVRVAGLQGIDRDKRVTIEQTQPLPATVLLLSGVLSVGS